MSTSTVHYKFKKIALELSLTYFDSCCFSSLILFPWSGTISKVSVFPFSEENFKLPVATLRCEDPDIILEILGMKKLIKLHWIDHMLPYIAV